MRRHTRSEIYAARQRNIERWRRYRREYVEDARHPIQPGDWWAQEGRFNKLTLSCRDHAMCRGAQYESKFRAHRTSVYARLDVADREEQ